jgi:hypothetical protein
MKEAEIKNLFGKLKIEAPSAGFEERIIANATKKKHSWHKSYAAVAAALLVVFSFSIINNPRHSEAKKEYAMLVDSAIDDDVYSDLIY